MPPLAGLDPPKQSKRSSGAGRNPTGAALIKKQAIKRVAARLFAERGVAAVGLASIGMVAQLPNRGVSYYYRHREDLLGDILVDHVLWLTQLMGAAYDETETAEPIARLNALVLVFHETVLRGRDAHRAMLFNLALLPPHWQSAVLGAIACCSETERSGWLSPLRPDAAPLATWNNFSTARGDTAVATAQPLSAARDGAATRARLTVGLEAFERISAREALHRWYEVLPIAASGVTFVITSRDYPLAQLGPLPSGIVSPASGCDSPAKP